MVRLWVRNEVGRFEESDSSPMEGHRYGVNQVEFSPNGELLASCSHDGSTILWDASVSCLSQTVEAEVTKCVWLCETVVVSVIVIVVLFSLLLFLFVVFFFFFFLCLFKCNINAVFLS
jgi:WD40 repeat protein